MSVCVYKMSGDTGYLSNAIFLRNDAAKLNVTSKNLNQDLLLMASYYFPFGCGA